MKTIQAERALLTNMSWVKPNQTMKDISKPTQITRNFSAVFFCVAGFPPSFVLVTKVSVN